MDANQPNAPREPGGADAGGAQGPARDEPVRGQPGRGEPVRNDPVRNDPESGGVAPGQERRSGEERRVEQAPVSADRRAETRRAADRQAAAREARAERRHEVIDRVTLGVDYLFYLLYGLLGLRFLLAALGASENAGFVRFIQGITDPFYAPFSGIVSRPGLNGGYLDFPLIIAVLAYILLHLAVRGLLRLIAGDRTVP